MAWGKGGSTNVVHVTTRGRRAYSVPAADVSYQPVGGRTASAVNYAKADAENISIASRRHDQRLMNDITSRLANAQFTQPAPLVRESRSRTRRSRAPSAPSSRRASVSSIYSVPYKPKSLADEEFEIEFPPELKPGRGLAPCARRALNRSVFQRSASLPPTSSPKPASRGGLIDLGSPLFRVVNGGPSKPAYVSPFASLPKEPMASPWAAPPPAPARDRRRRYSFAFEAPETVPFYSTYTPYVSAYYPTATPRPHIRRYSPLPPRTHYSYVRENDYKPAPVIRRFRASSEPRPTTTYTPSSHLAVQQARACLGRIERELGMGSVSVGDDPPYMDEPIVTRTTVVPVRASRTGVARGSMPPRRSGYNYGVVSSRPPTGPSASRRHEIEARLETMIVPEPAVSPASYSSLRSRTTEASNKLHQHGRLLDRYLPIPSGPPNDVPYEVEYRFKELQDRTAMLSRRCSVGLTNNARLPHLQNRERAEVSRATSLPPYRPMSTYANKGPTVNSYSDPLRTQPFRPKVSDTRKRARDVLCRTKRDPHYFDY